MKQYISTLGIICMTLFGFAQDIQSNTEGFSLTLSPTYASWSSESFFLGSLDELEPAGIGLAGRLAYGINQNLEVFLGYGFESFQREEDWDTYIHTAFDFGARFNFGATLKKWRPFLEAAITRNDMTIDPIVFANSSQLFKLNVKGVSGTVGVGSHFFIQRNLSLNAQAKGSFGNFNQVFLTGQELEDVGESLDFELYRIQIGLTYFFE